jgi:hypothetical protein
MMIRVLRLPRQAEYRKIDLKEVMAMLSLFVVDDDIIDFFLNANIASDLFFYMKEDRVDRRAGVINLITIMIHLFRLKSYAFSKSLKVDFLVFVFKQYERAEAEDFKIDLLQLLCSLYQIKEFRKLLNDEEVLIELKYRTDIVEIEELIVNELSDERKILERQREIEISQGKHRARSKKPDTDWTEHFTKYMSDPMAHTGLVQKDTLPQLEKDDLLKIQKEENEGILMDDKTKHIHEFLTELRIRGPNAQTSEKAKKASEDLADIKELILVQHENVFYKAKAKLSDLKKENEKLKSLLYTHGIDATKFSPTDGDADKSKQTSLGSRVTAPAPYYGRLPSLSNPGLIKDNENSIIEEKRLNSNHSRSILREEKTTHMTSNLPPIGRQCLI